MFYPKIQTYWMYIKIKHHCKQFKIDSTAITVFVGFHVVIMTYIGYGVDHGYIGIDVTGLFGVALLFKQGLSYLVCDFGSLDCILNS